MTHPKTSVVRRFARPLALLAFLTLLVIVALVAFRSRPVPTGGTLIYSDDFERAELGPDYAPATADRGFEAGTWAIVDGRLKGEQIHNATLWLQKPLPPNVRIEFTARALSATGDVKCEVFGDGQTHQSGYIVLFGAWRNTVNAIARQDEHGEDRKEDKRCGVGRQRRCVEPDVDYRWAVQRTGGTVEWYLDGSLFLTFPDSHPLTGRHFGFGNWEAPVTFDDLAIYDLGG